MPLPLGPKLVGCGDPAKLVELSMVRMGEGPSAGGWLQALISSLAAPAPKATPVAVCGAEGARCGRHSAPSAQAIGAWAITRLSAMLLHSGEGSLRYAVVFGGPVPKTGSPSPATLALHLSAVTSPRAVTAAALTLTLTLPLLLTLALTLTLTLTR